jgi:peptide/nickel transport system permease protein
MTEMLQTVIVPSEKKPVRKENLFWQVLTGVVESKAALVGLIVCVVILLLAVFAPWVVPQDPYNLATLNILDSRLPPGSKGFSGGTYWLGTDGQGRDMISAMIYGLRTSLGVGLLSGVFAIVVGTTLGLLAAYRGGWVDAFIMRWVDLMLGFPAILVALILLAILGQGVDKVVLALVIVQWAFYARTVRGTALAERSKEYVEAARCLALGHRRILFRHLLPNCMPPIIVIAAVRVASAISAEATLSFLGLGVPITKPSLGLLIANGYKYLLSGSYWISFFPGFLLMVTIFSINIVGDRLREVLNPRLQEIKVSD